MYGEPEGLEGKVARVEERLAGHTEALAKHEIRHDKAEARLTGIEQTLWKAKWWVIGAVAGAGILTGSGRLSLDAVLKRFGL